MTKQRLGWWLRIALTAIFGRKVFIEGRAEPLKILPWIHRGRVLLMGAERELLQIRFTNQYALAIQSAPSLTSATTGRCGGEKNVCHVILCHQTPELVESIISWHRKLSSEYRVVLAYGGNRGDFERIMVEDKMFIEDPSLRGPTNRMSHLELLQKTMALVEHPERTRFVFSEGDLLPLRPGYLDPAIKAMIDHDAGFLAKDIRNITSSNNVFLTNAIENHIVSHISHEHLNGSQLYLHCLGCFFGIDGIFLGAMIEECQRMKGLYFEVMFPTAAARAGAPILSIDLISDYLAKVRYRPFQSIDEVMRATASDIHLVHPVREGDLTKLLSQLLP